MAKYKLQESALRKLWESYLGPVGPKGAPPFNISEVEGGGGMGICKKWAEDPYAYGPPLTPELKEPNGNVVQLFMNNAIRWTPGGAEVLY